MQPWTKPKTQWLAGDGSAQGHNAALINATRTSGLWCQCDEDTSKWRYFQRPDGPAWLVVRPLPRLYPNRLNERPMTNYRTFKRSCRNWQEFASARKITEETGLTYDQAAQRCRQYNDNRTSAQIRKGTKLEFEKI